MINVLLNGGIGSRLWPLSNVNTPKQYLKLFENKSLFQKTFLRNNLVCDENLIVLNQEHYFLMLDQINELNISHNSKFLLEPVGRNTAASIALACFNLNYDDLVIVTPSDHLIKSSDEYSKMVEKAKEIAEEDYIVLFGIKPDEPNTGYGYIEPGEVYKTLAHEVRAFHEKPDAILAKEYISNNYYWNSGIFCFKAGIYLDELKKYSKNIYDGSKLAHENSEHGDFIRVPLDFMESIEDNSIDYAVLEKSDKLKLITTSDIGWTDLGSFDNLSNEINTDEHSNTVLNMADVELDPCVIDSHNNFFVTSSRQIATVDVDDLVVVDTEDALLISKKGSTQKIKKIIKKLSDLKKAKSKIGYRPWGHYQILEERENYKIKKIIVKPGKKLSLQKHFHRSEHWVVVSGTAEIHINKNKHVLTKNESTYINIGDVHRLCNPGKIDLVLIEVQLGEYIEEDDIVRYEDEYNRI